MKLACINVKMFGFMNWSWHAYWALQINLVLVCMVLSGDVKPRHENYMPDYTVYHNASKIQSHLKEIADRNSKYVHIDWTFNSRMGRPQMVLRITNFTDSQSAAANAHHLVPKVKVLLSFGEHAREFLPVESMFFLLKNITSGLKYPENHPAEIYSRKILTRVDLFVVGILNPDGRMRVEETQNYCWRGTSNGVDINRNFDWQFGYKGSSNDALDEEYRGTHPFSEPESLVLTELTKKFKFDAFASLHSGIRQIYIPFADTKSKSSHRKPENVDNMLELADQMSHATSKLFTYGLAYQLNEYTADGTIFDYMAGVRKIPFSYAIELWGKGDHPKAECFDLFNPKNEDLQEEVTAIHPIYVTLMDYVISWKEREIKVIFDPAHDAPSLTFGYSLLGILIVITILVAFHNRLPVCMRFFPRRRIVNLRSLSSTFSVMSILKP